MAKKTATRKRAKTGAASGRKAASTASRRSTGRSKARKTATTRRRPARRTAVKKAAAPRRTRLTAAQMKGALAAQEGVTPDALRMLEQDHREVDALFKQFEDLEAPAEKAEMAAKICLLLTVHATIEEELLYPAARKVLDREEHDMVDEAVVEHASAKQLIAEIEAMKPREKLFDAKVKVLGEYVRHHVREEENEVFPALRDAGLDVYKLGAALTERKVALLAELAGEA